MGKYLTIAAGPFAIAFALWFFLAVEPLLPVDLQKQIDDGGLGMMIGLFGGMCVLVCCMASWKACTEMFAKRTTDKQ